MIGYPDIHNSITFMACICASSQIILSINSEINLSKGFQLQN